MTHKNWIVKNVKFNLEKILASEGYTFDVGLVDLTQLEIHSISPTPAIVLVTTGLKRNYLPSMVMEFELSYLMISVVRLTDLEGASNIIDVLDEFEADIVRCHHEDLFLRTAFTTNPDVPAELAEFHLRDHKLGDAEYVFTKDRAHARIEATTEYEIYGQENI